MISRIGARPIGVWIIKHLVSPFQRWIYRVTGGAGFAGQNSDHGVLLLTTKGRRTGKDRTIPVFFLRDGEYVILCNVNPGFERTNPWVINLRADPVAKLQIRGEIAKYHAREATDAEIKELWPRLVEVWSAYQDHYERSGKRAVFIMERMRSS